VAEAEAEVGIGGRDGSGRTSEAEVMTATEGMANAAEAEAVKAAEAAACIGGIGMHRKSMEADRADGADGDGKCQRRSKRSELVRTCQNRMVLVWGHFCCM
jgi:hypothetical protein